jgi:hypothetical protein
MSTTLAIMGAATLAMPSATPTHAGILQEAAKMQNSKTTGSACFENLIILSFRLLIVPAVPRRGSLCHFQAEEPGRNKIVPQSGLIRPNRKRGAQRNETKSAQVAPLLVEEVLSEVHGCHPCRVSSKFINLSISSHGMSTRLPILVGLSLPFEIRLRTVRSETLRIKAASSTETSRLELGSICCNSVHHATTWDLGLSSGKFIHHRLPLGI